MVFTKRMTIDEMRAVGIRGGVLHGRLKVVSRIVRGDLCVSVAVIKRIQGRDCDFWASAWLREYWQDTENWRSRPAETLTGCAEAEALRSACSLLLNGVYTQDEPVEMLLALDEDVAQLMAKYT